MRFSGLHSKSDIPSRSFQVLQQMTGDDQQGSGGNTPTQAMDQNVKQNGAPSQPRRIIVKRSPSLSRSDQSSPKPEDTSATLEHVRSQLSHVEIKKEPVDSEDDRASGTNENIPWQLPPRQSTGLTNRVGPHKPRLTIVRRSPSVPPLGRMRSTPSVEDPPEMIESSKERLSHVELRREKANEEEGNPSVVNQRVPWRNPPSSRQRRSSAPSRRPFSDDESVGNYNETSIRYQGKKVPGKSFKMLQQLTGADDTVQPRQKSSRASSDDEGSVGNYNEASIRYMGRNTPGKTFKKLQSLTGSDDYVPPPARKTSVTKRYQSDEDVNADGPREVRYGGSHIPSKSFQALQMALGDPPTNSETAAPTSEPTTPINPPRTMKVIQVRKQSTEQPAVQSDGSAHASASEPEAEPEKRPVGIVGDGPLLPMSVARPPRGGGETEF